MRACVCVCVRAPSCGAAAVSRSVLSLQRLLCCVMPAAATAVLVCPDPQLPPDRVCAGVGQLPGEAGQQGGRARRPRAAQQQHGRTHSRGHQGGRLPAR